MYYIMRLSIDYLVKEKTFMRKRVMITALAAEAAVSLAACTKENSTASLSSKAVSEMSSQTSAVSENSSSEETKVTKDNSKEVQDKSEKQKPDHTQIKSENNEQAEEDKVMYIQFEHMYEDGQEWAVITAYDADGETVWSKASEKYPGAQIDRVVELGINDDMYYYVEDGQVNTVDKNTGEIRWINGDKIGSPISSCHAFDEEGNLYVAPYFGGKLYVMDKDGNILNTVNFPDGEEYYRPYKMSMENNALTVTFEGNDLNDSTITYDPAELR